MKKSKYSDKQIIGFIKEVDAGAKVNEIARRAGVTVTTFYRWKAKLGGMDVSDARRLRDLEDENTKLKQIVAEQALDLQMTRAVIRKKW
jgi:putative transposase